MNDFKPDYSHRLAAKRDPEQFDVTDLINSINLAADRATGIIYSVFMQFDTVTEPLSDALNSAILDAALCEIRDIKELTSAFSTSNHKKPA